MKVKKLSLFFGVIIFSLLSINTNHFIYSGIPSPKSSDTGVSGYTITGSITYQVEINFTLTHNNLNGFLVSSDYNFKFARLNNRHPNSSLTHYTPPYQESLLLYHKIIGSDYVPYFSQDKFNNTYDIFNATLSPSQSIILNQKYNITLNAISFPNIEPSSIGIYDTSDDIFDLYCNKSEIYYEKNDPVLNATSFSIVDPSDNPVEKAQKIYNWVSSYLTYDGTLPGQEKGALWALNNSKGDCSEYSSLMITLLRCQGIPARKVTGYVFSNNPNIQPTLGEQKTFYISRTGGSSSTNFLGHAWVEYYVPNIGWIACDPTWNNGANYFNRIDSLRFASNIGAWFTIPLLPEISEFPNPCIVYDTDADFNYDYNVVITVIESSKLPLDPLTIIITVGTIAAIVSVIILIIVISNKRKKRAKEGYY
ncbi:MAG: transglutaminase family protein [Promethearchaeota archaeon]